MTLTVAQDEKLFEARANNSGMLINDVLFNRTTLQRWNYTLYNNGTLSNRSDCWLIFGPYKPFLFSNGTFINGTSCFSPINPIRARGITGLVFGTLFATTILFTLINLRKHGRSFLPREKRWRAVGRRWQWYWMLFVAAGGIISAFTGVDVDRDYLQGTAIILQSFFYTLIFPGLLACVWEAVRNWGSWQERQIYDADPFALRQNDGRVRREFYMPLVFYTLDWMVFFMTIPRPWTPIQMQRSPSQTEEVARVAATDGRFKAAAIMAFAAWCIICFSLGHSIYHYKQSRIGSRFSLISMIRTSPSKLLFAICLVAVRVAYFLASAWTWSISPYRAEVAIGWLYGLGYIPCLLTLIIFNGYGYSDMNEEKILMIQRAHRGEEADTTLGIGRASRKPSWWSKSYGKVAMSPEERLRHLTSEVGDGGLSPFDSENMGRNENDLEMRQVTVMSQTSTVIGDANDDDSGRWWWQRRKAESEAEAARKAHTARSSGSSRYVLGSSMLSHEEPVERWRERRNGSTERSEGSERSRQSRPQVVRSMLDL